jgi:hypothetical protein
MFLSVNSDYSLNRINHLILVMVKCDVLFKVRTGFLHNIKMSVSFKGISKQMKIDWTKLQWNWKYEETL